LRPDFDPADGAALLRARLAGPVDTAIVLGTGLGPLAEAVPDPVIVPYSDIPGFPPAGVSGHAGRAVIGVLGRRRVLLMQGRAHYYESGDAAVMRPALETLKAVGVSRLLLTNAAGSLRPEMPPGSLCIIRDHINLSGANPLIGDGGDGRFVPMTEAYSPALRRRLATAAAAAGLAVGEGVYCWVSGPSFETPAEIRAIGILGGDLVGMSTVPEVIIARRIGLEVGAVSIVTNFGAGIKDANPSHDETKEVAMVAGDALRRLVLAFLEQDDG
jgi:purine-nucleoside phosphorylase